MNIVNRRKQPDARPKSSQLSWWTLKTKLIVIVLGVAIVPLVIVGIFTFGQSQDSLRQEAQNNLEAVRSLKATQIEQYFDSVAQDIQSVAQLEVMNEAHQSIASTASQIVGLEEVREGGFLGNPERTAAETFNAYSLAHEENYDLLSNITKAGGYADLMLVNGINGDIVYTYAKNDDFATNLFSGPYSDTHLGRMVQQMMEEKEVGKVYRADFAKYTPVGDTPVGDGRRGRHGNIPL
jgi:methyl-accepting chemotaxis protein